MSTKRERKLARKIEKNWGCDEYTLEYSSFGMETGERICDKHGWTWPVDHPFCNSVTATKRAALELAQSVLAGDGR